jgi:hypothetical protein
MLRRGMGVGTAEGVAVGKTIMAAAPATGPAAPIVAAVGELTELVSSFIGGGCGQACIASAQAEQIYEYAGQCLDAVAKAGMLSQGDLVSGLESILSAGQQHLQSLESQDPQAAKGLTNLTSTLTSDINAAGGIPSVAPNPLDISQAATLFPSTTGWYAGSASAGAQLALAYLQSLPASSSLGSVTVAGASISKGMIYLAGAGILLLGFWWFSKGEA